MIQVLMLATKSEAPIGTVLLNIYSADIVTWLEKSAKQITNLYKYGINL